MRAITLGNGKRVTLGQYTRAIQIAKASPDRLFDYGLTGWSPAKGSDVVQQFRTGLHERITAGIPRSAEFVRQAAREYRRACRRLLDHIHKVGRNCKECGQHFTPKTVSDFHCSNNCRAAYYH